MKPMETMTPPHNREAEDSIIGACLLDEDALFFVRDTVRASDFYTKPARLVYGALLEMEPPRDIQIIANQLQLNGVLEEVGGLPYLAECMDRVPAPGNVEHYAAIVLDHARRRAAIKAAMLLEEGARGEPDFDEVLRRHEKGLTALSVNRREVGLLTGADLTVERQARMETLRQSGTTGLLGVSTGLAKLDASLRGLRPGHLIVLAARPSMGKTALCLHFLTRCGVPALGFSLEQPRAEWTDRMLASLGRVQMDHLETEQYDVEEQVRYPQAEGKLGALPLRIDDTAGLTAEEVCSRARRAHREQPLGLIVVDYLGKLRGRKGQSDYERVTEAAGLLKDLARELHVPVVALAQLNRDLEKRPVDDRRPRLSDLRDSGAIEQDADVVLFLFRQCYYDSDAKATDAEILIAKARQGRVGTVEVDWFGPYQLWRDRA